MKKSARIIISLVLVFALALCVLTACNKDKTEVKNIDENEIRIMFTGANSVIGTIGSKTGNVKVDYKTNFKGVETVGFSICTQDNGSYYDGNDGYIIHNKETVNGVETENYIGYNFKVMGEEIKKIGDAYNLVKVTKNGVAEKQVNKYNSTLGNMKEYNDLFNAAIVFYINGFRSTIFGEYGDIIDTVEYSGTRTYNNDKLENTTICATYVDEENSINGKITLVLSADEKQISKATVEQNGVVVFEGTYTYGVDTIIMPEISGSTWEERTSYETV